MQKKRKKCILILIIASAVILMSGSYASIKKIKERDPKENVRKIETAEGQEAAGADTENYEQELELLSSLIEAEAGDLSDECQIAVASVVLNRINHPSYPDTVYDVIYQPGQYGTVENGKIENEPDENARKNAEYVLQNGSQIPENVVYQGMNIQGSGIWDVIDKEYFCYE